MSLRLLLLLLLALPLRAAGPDEKLAGEDDKAVPTAVPTPLGDDRGTVSATRTAQAAPSFDLPAFVVTGSGERQALARRQDLGLAALDTSGGIKTSPGEQGAGKDQLEAAGGRESFESLSGASKPFVAGLRLGAGWQPGYDGAAYIAQQLEAWSWSLDGDAAYSEGGPKRGPMRDRALADQGGLRARVGWRGEDGSAINAFGRGAFATRAPQPYIVGQTDALRRGAFSGGLEGESLLAGTALRGRAGGGSASLRAVGSELFEDHANLDLELSRRFSGRTGSAFLEAALGVDSSSQSFGGVRRSRSLLRGSLLSRFEVIKGTRLGLGLAVDAASGDDQALQLGPVLRWDQRLGSGLSLNLSLDSGLRLSRLKSSEGAGEAWHAPDPALKPAHLALDAKADLHWLAAPGLRFSVGAFSQEGEDWFLPSASSGSVLAVDRAVRGWRLQGLRAGQRWAQGPWWQSAEALLQRAELPDLAGWASFTPAFSARLSGGWAQGPYSIQASLQVLGARHGALDGSLPMEPSADLSARAAWDLNDAWSLYAEGRNLAAQVVEPAPYYPAAAPYAGLGLELRF